MKKENILIGLGLLVFILPFLGIPGNIKTVFYVGIGLSISVLALIVRSELLRMSTTQGKRTNSFVENGTPSV